MPLLFPYDFATLSPDTKRILYRYDCDCEPIVENQLGHFQANEFCIYIAHIIFSGQKLVKMSEIGLLRLALHMMF